MMNFDFVQAAQIFGMSQTIWSKICSKVVKFLADPKKGSENHNEQGTPMANQHKRVENVFLVVLQEMDTTTVSE